MNDEQKSGSIIGHIYYLETTVCVVVCIFVREGEISIRSNSTTTTKITISESTATENSQ